MRNRGCFVTVDLTNSVDSGRYRPAAATAAGSEAVVEVLAASGGDRRASFFVTAACARELPAVVFSLAGRGHEIACHGGRLEAAFASDRAAFTAVLARSLAALEDIANQRIIGYRTAEPLSPADRATPLEALADCGIAYDSSVSQGGSAPSPGRQTPRSMAMRSGIGRSTSFRCAGRACRAGWASWQSGRPPFVICRWPRSSS